ncbi:MAG: ABC transporter permease [Clostridia bacterium]|nr:ABC transporter permease [Clostridia bacterium]MBQ4575774.1 ABC transporter permease [Clostridia bacterium]
MNKPLKLGGENRFHVVKRAELPFKQTALLYILAIVLALVAGGIFILCIGHNPFSFYATLISGCFRSKLAFVALIKIIMPLLLTTLGVAVAFKMKFWNIGAEGQFIMGAICATYFALYWGDMPHFLLVIVMMLAGFVGGGIWGLIPAYFKCRFDTNETLLTLMLNYIALYIVQYLRDGPWRDPAAGGFLKIAKHPESAWLDKLFGIDITWVICIILVVIMFIYLSYTKQGYEIAVVGDSHNTARYAGMNVKGIILRTMFISAAVCGLAGMLQVTGDATSHTLTMGIASGVGFTAIIVAWLAKLNPFGILLVSTFFGILDKGSGVAESTFGLSSSVADVLQGIILFFILGLDFFIRYKIVISKSEHEETKEAAK